MPNNHLVPRASLLGGVLASREDKAAGTHLASLQTGALLQRAEAAIQRDLAMGKVSDIADVAEHALGEGGRVAGCLAAEIEKRPFAAQGLSQLAEQGFRDIARAQRHLGEGW